MFNKNPDRGYNVILRFIISGVITLVIIFAIGSITYRNSLDLARTNTITTTIGALEKTMNFINTKFIRIRNVAAHVSTNKDLVYLKNINSTLKNADYYKLRRFSNELKQYSLTDNFIDDFIIYFPQTNALVSPNYIYNNLDILYGKLFEYNEKSFTEWEEALTENHYFTIWPSQNITLHSREKTVITYTMPEFTSFQKKPGYIISILIEENKIIEHLKSIDASEEINYCIVDNNRNIIVSDDKNKINEMLNDVPIENFENSGSIEVNFGDDIYTVVYVKSPYHNLTYISVISPKYFTESIFHVKKLFLLTGIFALVASLIYITFAAFLNSKPIRTVIDILKDSSGLGYNYSVYDDKTIKSTLLKIISDNREMQDKLAQQMPILRENIIKRLLLGEFYFEDEVYSALSYADLNLDYDSFAVILMNIHGFDEKVTPAILEEINLSKIIAENVIRNHFQEQLFFCNIDDDKTAIIICFSSKESVRYKEGMQENLKVIIDELHKCYNIRVNFAIGKSVENIMEIPHSYTQAKTSLDSIHTKNGMKIIWYNNCMNEITGYYYPMDIELKLMRLVKMGKEEEVLKLLDDIYSQNFDIVNLSQKEIKQLIYEIRGTLVKLCIDLTQGRGKQEEEFIANLLNTMDMSQSTNKIYKNMYDIFRSLCSMVNIRKKSRNDELIDKIIDYIGKNYANTGLSLYDVASQFGLSDKYLSDFFKEQIGESFSSYLEELRIKCVLELLEDENLSIESIAKKSGYNSPNTLYKAFKRKFGVSPREYKRRQGLLSELIL